MTITGGGNQQDASYRTQIRSARKKEVRILALVEKEFTTGGIE